MRKEAQNVVKGFNLANKIDEFYNLQHMKRHESKIISFHASLLTIEV